MKFSEAMLKGYESNGGRQTRGAYVNRSGAMCVIGAVSTALEGEGVLRSLSVAYDLSIKFDECWGVCPQTLNDDGMPWEHIYGMAVAAGL